MLVVDKRGVTNWGELWFILWHVNERKTFFLFVPHLLVPAMLRSKAIYWACVHEINIFIAIIITTTMPTSAVRSACFWLVMYSSPGYSEIICFQIWNTDFSLANPVSSLISFPPAIVFTVMPINKAICTCCNNCVILLHKWSCLWCSCVAYLRLL